MAVAFASLAQAKIDLKGKLFFTGVVGEETGSIGMNHLLPRLDPKPTYCLVSEPTSLDIGIAHKGSECITIQTQGKSAHGSTPKEGINAINHMEIIIQQINDYLIPLLENRKHPLLGSPTINLGTIRGGKEHNIVPEQCTIEVDRRWLPGETTDKIRKEFQTVIEQAVKRNSQVEASIIDKGFHDIFHGPLEIEPNHPLIKAIKYSASLYLDREPREKGLTYWTDGALAQKGKIAAAVCGPGNPSKAHTADESVPINQLVQAAKIYTHLALSICETKND